RRHTIFDCDWSSDVCSSDLTGCSRADCRTGRFAGPPRFWILAIAQNGTPAPDEICIELHAGPKNCGIPRVRRLAWNLTGRESARSEERRVGKECRGGTANEK